jgi:ferredoxin-NADP reductase
VSGTGDVIEVRVLRRTETAEGIIVLDLAAPEGVLLPAFEAGAHVDVHVGPGLVRQYSLANDPADTNRYRLGILLEPESRGGSAAIHKEFAEGRTIRISVPRSNFKLVDGATKSILLAGGIGVTPLLAMAYRLQAQRADFELHYCTRTRGRTAFMEDIAAASFAGRVSIHHDDGPVEQRLDPATLPPPAPGVHLYVCGPGGFMEWIIGAAKACGYADDHVHKEYFSAEVDVSGDTFVVEARRSGKTVTVPADKSIADALADVGIDLPLSCEQGVCGTCLTDVIEGVPDHRDMYQTDQEKVSNRQITPCCSRAKSAKLVLDC